MGCKKKKRFPADRKQSIGRVIFFIKISVRKAYLNPCQSYVKLELLQSLITAGFIRNGTESIMLIFQLYQMPADM